MDETEDNCDVHDMSPTTPVQHVPCDVGDQSAPLTSPGKPEVDVHSSRELVTSPEAAADASPRGGHRVGVTCDAPASPIGAVSEQEREQASAEHSRPVRSTDSPCRLVEYDDVIPMTSSSSSYFGESHVTRLQSFVDSVAAGDEALISSWSRGRLHAEHAGIARAATGTIRNTTLAPSSDLRKPVPRHLAAAASEDEPLDLSRKTTARRPDPTSSVSGEIPFPVPVVPPLFPLLACRESWIAHWAALAAASLQHSLLFPPLAVTSQSGADTASGPSWMTSSSPHSSSSSSPGGTKMADESRRTALTAMESFVESSFKPRQQQQQQQQQQLLLLQQRQRLLRASSGHDLSHPSSNRKRRRHHGAEVTSSGEEDGGSREEKRKRSEISFSRAEIDNAKDESISPHNDDRTPQRDDVTEMPSAVTSPSTPEANGEEGYLSCGTRYDGTTEHPLVSLEKFVGVSAPLFSSSAAPPAAVSANGISSPMCRSPAIVDVKTPSDDDGDCRPQAVTSRSMRAEVASGSLGRGFTQSVLCCNL